MRPSVVPSLHPKSLKIAEAEEINSIFSGKTGGFKKIFSSMPFRAWLDDRFHG